jgi:hypothetical protein
MEQSFGFEHSVNANIERQRPLDDGIKFKGRFKVEVIRDGKTIRTEYVNNDVVNEGKDKILDSFFRNQAPPAQFYLGLMNDPATLAAADVMAGHAGWTEFTAYSEATRPAWTTQAAASQSITNPTPATFTITGGAATINGIFVPSENTKSGATGILWSTAPFTGPIPVTGGDIIKISYTVNAV